MFTRAGQPSSLCSGAICGVGSEKDQCCFVRLSADFQSLFSLPSNKLDPSGAESWVSGFAYILGPCGSLQWTLLWSWEFFLPSQSPKVFSVRGFEALFPKPGKRGLSHFPVVPPGLSARKCGTTQSASHYLILLVFQPLPFCMSSLPLLPVWWNVASVTPGLLDFHTVRFSGSSGYFLFLNLLLSFFRLCKETKYIYLCLHLGWKFQEGLFLNKT